MRRLPVVDGLRGLAILAVIYHHTLSPKAGLSGTDPLSVLSQSGWHGVNLFFVLSGFVLYLPFADGQRGFSTLRDVGDFLIKRGARLLPLYYFTTLIFIPFFLTQGYETLDLLKDVALYVPAVYIFNASTFMPKANWVLWSLGIEIWFSVLFPFLVIAIRKTGWRTVLVAAICISLAASIYGHLGESRAILNSVADSLPARLSEFVFGMLAAHVYIKRPDIRMGIFTLTTGLTLIWLSLELWVRWEHGSVVAWKAGLFNLPLDVGMTLCLLAMLSSCRAAARVMSIWPMQLFGMMCYSIYLWHGQIYVKMDGAESVSRYIAYLAVLLGISWMTYRFIEFRRVDDWRRLLPDSSLLNRLFATAKSPRLVQTIHHPQPAPKKH